MTTLTRSNSRATVAPPCYKDYMNFLGNYKNGKSENFALTNNDSSTSVNSDVTDFSKPAVSFNAYIENLKNKKFNTVDLNLESKENSDTKPDFPKSQSVSVPKNPQTEEKVVVKNEIFVTQTEEKVSKKSEIFIEVQPTKPVSEVSKMFEKKQNKAPTKSTKMNSKINIFEKQISQEKPKLAEKPILPKIETEIQRVMPPRAQPINGSSSPAPPPTQKLMSPKAQPINGPSFPPPPPPLTQKVTTTRAPPINGPSSPPPPPPLTQKVMTTRAQPINVPSSPPPPPPLTQKVTPLRAQPINGPPRPPPIQCVMPPRAQAINGTSSPPPPPPPAQLVTNASSSPSPPPVAQNEASLPPPPPPLPVMNTPPKMQATLIKGPQIKHSVTNPSGVVPEEIDRNNPMVKKLVYGTLRGMVGAYHEKANDIMATLPKNMVKKSNGVQDIIEKIASNGDLEKLNGRVNPKADQE